MFPEKKKLVLSSPCSAHLTHRKDYFPYPFPSPGDSVAKTAIYAIDGNARARVCTFAHIVDENYILERWKGDGG